MQQVGQVKKRRVSVVFSYISKEGGGKGNCWVSTRPKSHGEKDDGFGLGDCFSLSTGGSWKHEKSEL